MFGGRLACAARLRGFAAGEPVPTRASASRATSRVLEEEPAVLPHRLTIGWAPWRANRRRAAAAGRTRARAGSPAPRCRPRPGRSASSAMSMPADTPAAVTYLPSNTTRSSVASRRTRAAGPGRASAWSPCGPSSSPAAASTSEPVHTDVVQVLVSSTCRSQSQHLLVRHQVHLPRPARHEHDVGLRHVGGRRVHDQPECAAARPHLAVLLADEHHLGLPREPEHLVRPDGVQRRHPVEEQDRDTHDRSPSVCGAVPTVSANTTESTVVLVGFTSWMIGSWTGRGGRR